MNTDELITSHMWLVDSIAWETRRRTGAAVDDLQSVGYEVLVTMADRWDPERGSFAAFVSTRVRGAMIDDVRRMNPAARRHNPVKMLSIDAPASDESGDKIDDGTQDVFLPPTLDPTQQVLEAAELSARVNEMLATMKPAHQAAVGALMSGKRLQTVADEHGVTGGAVTQWVHGGLSRLAPRLLEEGLIDEPANADPEKNVLEKVERQRRQHAVYDAERRAKKRAKLAQEDARRSQCLIDTPQPQASIDMLKDEIAE